MKQQNKKQVLFTLTEISLLNFSLRDFYVFIVIFPFVMIFVLVPFWLHLLHLPLTLMTHLLFCLRGVRHHINTSSKCQKRLYVHVYIRTKISVMRFFFWLREIFVCNLLRKRCLQAKFYQKRGKKIRRR